MCVYVHGCAYTARTRRAPPPRPSSEWLLGLRRPGGPPMATSTTTTPQPQHPQRHATTARQQPSKKQRRLPAAAAVAAVLGLGLAATANGTGRVGAAPPTGRKPVIAIPLHAARTHIVPHRTTRRRLPPISLARRFISAGPVWMRCRDVMAGRCPATTTTCRAALEVKTRLAISIACPPNPMQPDSTTHTLCTCTRQPARHQPWYTPPVTLRTGQPACTETLAHTRYIYTYLRLHTSHIHATAAARQPCAWPVDGIAT